MHSPLADARLVLTPMPAAHFGTGAVGELPGLVRGTAGSVAVIVTDPALGTPRAAPGGTRTPRSTRSPRWLTRSG